MSDGAVPIVASVAAPRPHRRQLRRPARGALVATSTAAGAALASNAEEGVLLHCAGLNALPQLHRDVQHPHACMRNKVRREGRGLRGALRGASA